MKRKNYSKSGEVSSIKARLDAKRFLEAIAALKLSRSKRSMDLASWVSGQSMTTPRFEAKLVWNKTAINKFK